MVEITADQLPAEIPVFPLSRVILLPRVTLPLNIFEPRYLAMTDAAMAAGRLIGMIQPRPAQDCPQGLAPVGCAGRITAFTETEDGRYLVTLKGVCRFRVAGEEPLQPGGYRKIRADWSAYLEDLVAAPDGDVCRKTVVQTLRGYLDKMNMFCDQWEKMQDISCESLISTLSVVCPFSPEEKQALLEAPGLADRARLLQAFLENALRQERTISCH